MWGAGDQARVNWPILRSLGCELAALIDDTPGIVSPFQTTTLFAGWQDFEPWLRQEDTSTLGFVAAIGNPYGDIRCRLQDLLSGSGVQPVSFADDTALVCKSVSYGAGLQVMPHAMAHSNSVIGRQCLLNTRSLVEHDCVLEEGVEIGPGAILCGRVHVGAFAWIGAGTTIRPRVTIGKNTIVGAGSVVVSDIPDNVVAYGVPAKPVRENAIPNHSGSSRRTCPIS